MEIMIMNRLIVHVCPVRLVAVLAAACCGVFVSACSRNMEDGGAERSPAPAMSVPAGGGTVPESIATLMKVHVPLLALVVDAIEEEGMAFNNLNETLSEPVFHSVRWDQAGGSLLWRFWVAPEGRLMDELRAVPRAQAVALLKERMTGLAVLAGIEPMPGFDAVAGALTVFRVPTLGLISEEDMASARRQLAGVSIIQLAAPHPEGPILLVRMPDGSVVEQAIATAGEPMVSSLPPSGARAR